MFSRKNEFHIFPNFNPEQHNTLEIFYTEKETSHNGVKPFILKSHSKFLRTEKEKKKIRLSISRNTPTTISKGIWSRCENFSFTCTASHISISNSWEARRDKF